MRLTSAIIVNMDIFEKYKFDFCKLQRRADDILLLEFNNGIEVTAEMVDKLSRAANEVMSGPFAILSNRVNSYSVSFEAMASIAKYDNIAALAVVVHDAQSRILVETQNYFISALEKRPGNLLKPIRIFMNTDAAISWLQAVIQTANDIPQTHLTSSK